MPWPVHRRAGPGKTNGSKQIVELHGSQPAWTPHKHPDSAVLARFEKRVADANLRLMPYPFANALSIVTDLDASERDDYTAYREQLVDKLGLDFSDSAFLHCSGGTYPRNVRAVREMALSFFRYDCDTLDLSTATRDLASAFTFLEVLREYHLGNISHLHSYGILGPRIVPLGPASDIRKGEVRFPCLQEATEVSGFAVRQVPCLAVVVRMDESLVERIGHVEILNKAGESVGHYRHLKVPVNSWKPRVGPSRPHQQSHWFEFAATPGGDPAPMHSLAHELRISFEGGHVSEDMLGEAHIVGLYREPLKRMLDVLAESFNVRFNTLVDHNATSFIAPSTEKYRCGMNLDAHKAGGAASHYGRVRENELSFSTLADDPESTAYISDFVHDRLGIVYINPGGWSGESLELNLNNVLFPVVTRDGHGVYLARRVIPGLHKSDVETDDLKSDMGTRSFSSRLRSAIAEADLSRGGVWPIYTHLGNIRPKEQRCDPYLDQQPLNDLQERFYGFGTHAQETQRLWVTQPTTLYHYAAMMRSAHEQVSVNEGSCAVVTPWTDEVTGLRLGETPQSLHGLTIYVSDRESGRVVLGDKEIDDFTRNSPDETGRASLTIVGACAEHVIFDELAPEVLAETPNMAVCDWIEEEDAFSGRRYLRFTLSNDGRASFILSLPDFHPAGAQYLSYAVRIDEGIRGTSLALTTMEGASFCSRHGSTSGEGPRESTAAYNCAPQPHGEWRKHLVPFYDLTWSADKANRALPNRSLKSLVVVLEGKTGASVDLDCVSLIRARAGQHPQVPHEGFVFGGEVRTSTGAPAVGASVDIRVVESGTSEPRRIGETVADVAGLFAFTGLPAPSVVEVRTKRSGGCQSRPRRFELRRDSFSTILLTN